MSKVYKRKENEKGERKGKEGAVGKFSGGLYMTQK